MSFVSAFIYKLLGDPTDAVQAFDKVDKKAASTKGHLNKFAGDTAASFKNMAVGFAGAFAIGAIAAKTSEATDQMVKMGEAAKRMNVPVGDLDAWSRAVEDAGGSSESFQNTLSVLGKNIEQFKVKGKSKATPFLKDMGIDEKSLTTPIKSLEVFSKAFAKMTKEEAQGQGAKAGFDPVMIDMLRDAAGNTEALVAAQKKFGVMTEEQAKQLAEYDDAMDGLNRSTQQVYRALALALLPAVQWVAEAFTDMFLYFKGHQALLKGVEYGLIAIALVVTAMILPALASMAIGWIAATWPLLLLIAALAAMGAAIALVYQDFQVWMNGGNSLLGKHLGSFKDMKNQVIGFIEAIMDKWRALMEKWDEMKAGWQALKDNAPTWLGGGGGEAPNPTGSQAQDAAAAGQQAAAQADGSPYNAASGVPPSAGAQNTNTSVQTGTVVINTQATDAEGVAGAFSQNLEKQMNDAIAGSDNGVRI